MPTARYAILHHTAVVEPHYDLMIESAPGGPLRTWRSAVWPILTATQLEALADHRAAYLTYEGPVSNNRGYVNRVAGGTCEVTWPTDDHLIVRFAPDLALHFTKVDGTRWIANPI